MPVTSCDYLLFDQRYNQGNLRDVLRHVLPELNRMNPAGLRKCAASGRFRWLIWRDGKRFHLKQSYRDFLQLAPDLWANVRWVTRDKLQASCREVIRQMGYPGASFTVIGFGDSGPGRTTAEEVVTVEGSTSEGPGLSKGVHGSTDLAEGLVAKLEARYAEFFEDMGIDPTTGLLKGREVWKRGVAKHPRRPYTATSSGQHSSESVIGMYRNHHVGHGDLNANQRKAVDWGGAPVFVLADPASDKTVLAKAKDGAVWSLPVELGHEGVIPGKQLWGMAKHSAGTYLRRCSSETAQPRNGR